MAKQLGSQLNRIEKQMLQLSKECKRVRQMNNMIILNNRNDNALTPANNLLVNNQANDFRNNSNQLRPVKLLPIKNTKTRLPNAQFGNISNIINETKQHKKEVHQLDEELVNLKAEFEKRFERITSKQKLQLDGLEYIIKKVSSNKNAASPINQNKIKQ